MFNCRHCGIYPILYRFFGVDRDSSVNAVNGAPRQLAGWCSLGRQSGVALQRSRFLKCRLLGRPGLGGGFLDGGLVNGLLDRRLLGRSRLGDGFLCGTGHRGRGG